MLAYSGGPMRIAGWKHPVMINSWPAWRLPPQSHPIRFGHDPLSGVGHTDSIRIEQGQLLANGVHIPRDGGCPRSGGQFQTGSPWQASVGASVEEFEFIKNQQEQVTVNGRQYTGSAQRGPQVDPRRGQLCGPRGQTERLVPASSG